MEIRVYDQTMKLLGIIENQTSLLWIRRYYEPGSFELHAPITEFNLSLLKIGNLVTMYGREDAGIIESVHYEQSENENLIISQGRFLAAYMGYRLIDGTVNIDSTIETAMRDLLQRCTAIPLVKLDTLHGFTKTVSGQVKNSNLLAFMKKLAKAGTLGYHFRPDFGKKEIIFDIYQGINRSIGQSENGRVVFSEGYDNLNHTVYEANDQSYANVAYVYGMDKNQKEVSLVVGDTNSTGLERREIYVEGSSVDATELTDDQYIAALKQEGQNTLNAKAKSESFECSTNASGNFNYRESYDLGDVVTIRKESWNMQRDLRITEILETYEHGTMTVTPTFGNPLPTSIDWSDNT